MLDIRRIGAGNLPDAARLCLSGKSLSDRPRAFTRDVELDSTRCKLSLLREQMAQGSGGFAAYRSGMLVGYLEYHPVETVLQPVSGEDALVVGCLRVPEPHERPEVEKALLDRLAEEAAARRGVAILTREKELAGELGFEDAERDAAEVIGHERVLWWRATGGGERPRLVPVDRQLPKLPDKVRVDLFVSERCPWDRYVFDVVRGVCERMRGDVVVYETDCSQRRAVLRTGVAAGIAVNGQFQPWVRPYHLADEHTVRRTLEQAT